MFSIFTISSNRQLSSGTLICIVATPPLTTSRQHHLMLHARSFICVDLSPLLPSYAYNELSLMTTDLLLPNHFPLSSTLSLIVSCAYPYRPAFKLRTLLIEWVPIKNAHVSVLSSPMSSSFFVHNNIYSVYYLHF